MGGLVSKSIYKRTNILNMEKNKRNFQKLHAILFKKYSIEGIFNQNGLIESNTEGKKRKRRLSKKQQAISRPV